MKKAFFVLLVLNLIIIYSYAQKKGKARIDSLIGVLKTTRQDTSNVNTLNCIADEYKENNPDSAISCANKAMLISSNLKYEIGIANACLIKGIALKNLGNFETALKNSNSAIEKYNKLLPKSAGTITTGEKSMLLKNKAKALNNITVIYGSQGNYPEALKYCLEAIKIREDIGDSLGVGRSTGNIGLIYYYQGNYPDAIKYLSAALKIDKKNGDRKGVALCYNNLGLVYEKLRNYPEALKNSVEALIINQEINDKQAIGRSYVNIGNIYDDQGKYPEALKNSLASLKISKEIGDKLNIASSYNNIGLIYTKQKKYAEATDYFNKGLALAKEIGSLNDINNSYEGLVLLDSAQGNYAKALEHFKLHITTRDSMFSRENAKKMLQMEFDKKQSLLIAEQENKDALILKEMQKQKLVRNGLIGGFAVVFLFAAIFLIQRNKIRYGKNRSEELLLNILPNEVAEELKKTGHCQAKTFSMVTVMFTDFKDFTRVSELVSAELLVDEINYCFSAFDLIIQKYKVEKIKTVGDAYICVSGLPVLSYTHALDMINAAIEIRDFILARKKEKESKGEIPFELRIGIHTGPVVAGIVGVKKFQYDIWGDTVNIASRMESSGEPGQINISGATYALIKDKFSFIHRGKIVAKNKGEIDMYYVDSRDF